jgi:hypothetical protein
LPANETDGLFAKQLADSVGSDRVWPPIHAHARGRCSTLSTIMEGELLPHAPASALTFRLDTPPEG